MPDEAILNALAKKAELEIRITKSEEVIKRSRAQIIEISRFIKQWEKFSGRSADGLQEHKLLNGNKDYVLGQSVEKAATNPKKEVVAERVVSILEESGHSMSRAELFRALQEGGIHLQGANAEMVLSTMLWRTRDAFNIIRLKSGGYALPSMIGAQDEIDHDETSPD